MDYKEFFTRLKNGVLPRCLLLHGEEEYVKQVAVSHMRAALLPKGMEIMNEAVFEGAVDDMALMEACEILPFMGEKRLVIAREHPLIMGTGGDGGRLIEYIGKMPDFALLTFVQRDKADMRKRLPSAIAKIGGAVLFSRLGDQELLSYLIRECQKLGKKIDRSAVEHLIFLCGRDLTVLSCEIGKIIDYAGERAAITVQDIAAVAVPCLEANVFQMVDAALEGEAARTEMLCAHLLRDGQSPIMILNVLARNLRQLYHARLLLDAKRARVEIERLLGVSGFAAGRVLKRAVALDAEWLNDMQLICVQADYDIKSGQRREDAALDYILLKLLVHDHA